MRYININEIQLPNDWEDKANQLNQRLTDAENDAKRKEIIEANPIWKDLFVPLSNLSNGKCWYSEALDVMSDRDIDHFRPKGKAKNIDNIDRANENGYWWIAYDYMNYRFSSQFSNQLRKDKFEPDKATGGKWVYFPLCAGSIVANNKVQCEDEDIMLLDPCDEDDPPLLTFNERGVAIPNSNAIVEERDRIRVETSIKLYHLDHSPLQELRERIWDRCQRFIDEFRNIATNPDGVSQTGRNRAKFLKNEIRYMTKKEEELSAVAIACCEENGLTILAERR